MKQLFLLSLISISLTAEPIRLHLKSQKEKTQSSASAESDDVDGQVVLANVATMLGTIGMISTDPHNPLVLGPGLAQIGMSFINIITQIFKSHGFDEENTRAHVETWFMNLPDETKMEIISLFITYANQVRALHDRNYSTAP